MTENNSKIVEIYTDGACRGNPGKGGWGAILKYGSIEKELHGGEANTTNNRMEMTAALEALKALKQPCQVELTTDSQYLRKGITEWMTNWKKRDWKTADKKPVKNADLWKDIDLLNQKHTVNWHWVKGHSGHHYNERADQLANLGIDELK